MATVRTLGSKMMSSGGNPICWVSRSYARRQIRTLSSISTAWPDSSNAITTTAAPYRRISCARRRNSASPSFRLIELTIDLPCVHFSPASSTDHFELSIMTGTRLMSGSAAIRFRNRVIIASPSSSASSMFTSITLAPASTCSRAMATASSNFSSRIRRAKRREPVTFVRSPTIDEVRVRTKRQRLLAAQTREPLHLAECDAAPSLGPPAQSPRCTAGVVPQQPPTMFNHPCSANSRSVAAICRGVRSNPPNSFGKPGVGMATDVDRRDLRQLRQVRTHLLGTQRTVDADTQQAENARSNSRTPRSSARTSVRPAWSVIVTDAITGTSTPCSSKYRAMANRQALRFSVSNVVSGNSMSTPPSINAATCW